MNQWFQRGFEIKPGIRIKRMVCEEAGCWQIYDTSAESFVIATSTKLYSSWVEMKLLPESLFDSCGDLMTLISSPGYIIASMDKGPYPDNSSQLEAFSITFKTIKNERFNIEHAIYIEEYSLLLPVQNGNLEKEIVFGRWITGGINISINSFEDVCKAMTWLPVKELKKCIEIAGFDQAEIKEVAEEGETNSSDTDCYHHIPDSPFKLAGQKKLELFFNENIIDILRNKEDYKRMGINSPGAIVLFGPPGCGKTYAVEKLAEYLKWDRFDINSNSIASPYIHETGKKIAEVFDAAIAAAPSILIIDEMEAYLSNRLDRQVHGVEEMAEFLRKIPEATSKGVLVFAMTNMLDSIDKAIIRKGRFDHIVEISFAEKEDVTDLLNEKFKRIPVCDIDVAELAEKLEKRPMSDIAFVIKQAGRIAVKKKQKMISEECFEEALSLLESGERKNKKRIGFVVRGDEK